MKVAAQMPARVNHRHIRLESMDGAIEGGQGGPMSSYAVHTKALAARASSMSALDSDFAKVRSTLSGALADAAGGAGDPAVAGATRALSARWSDVLHQLQGSADALAANAAMAALAYELADEAAMIFGFAGGRAGKRSGRGHP